MSALYVIARHGNTFAPGEPARRIGARTDISLVASGRAQAERLGQHFHENGLRFDRVLTSPLRRTRESAALIVSAIGEDVPIEDCPWLAEIDHGPDEGATEDQVLARIGEAALAEWDAHALVPPGWQVDTGARQENWRTCFADAGAGTTLFVTSNGAARFALLADPGLTLQAAALPSLKLATGAYGVIRRYEDGLRIEEWNRRP